MSLILATVQILRDAGVADGRVYGVKIPDRETAHMPRKAVTVRGSGGGVTNAGGYMPTGDQRLDIKCFGADPWEAGYVDRQVAAVLHQWRRQLVSVTTPDGDDLELIVGSFIHTGGANELTDPDTDWPFSLSVWQVFGEKYLPGG